jgi:hypothetical protein
MRDHEGVAIDAGELSVRLAAIRASMERIDIGDLEAALFAQERAGDIAKHAACGPEKLFSALLRNIQAQSQPIEQGVFSCDKRPFQAHSTLDLCVMHPIEPLSTGKLTES